MYVLYHSFLCKGIIDLLSITRLAESEDGLLLATVHVDIPSVLILRVCVYCAVTVSSNTVSAPSVTVVESLVQVTLVAGPPVEIQVRVISGPVASIVIADFMPRNILTSPKQLIINNNSGLLCIIYLSLCLLQQ